jgi:hypothetical protein
MPLFLFRARFCRLLTETLQSPIPMSISILDMAVDEAVDAAELAVLAIVIPDMPAMAEVPIFILAVVSCQNFRSKF